MDVITCVPLDASQNSSQSNEYLSAVLQLVAKLRGGASRYLPLLAARVKEFPNQSPRARQMSLSIKQGYAGASDHLPTPLMPDTNGNPHFANLELDMRPIHRPAMDEQALIFDAYSSTTQKAQTPTDVSRSPNHARTPITPDVYGPPGLGPLPRNVVTGSNMYGHYPG